MTPEPVMRSIGQMVGRWSRHILVGARRIVSIRRAVERGPIGSAVYLSGLVVSGATVLFTFLTFFGPSEAELKVDRETSSQVASNAQQGQENAASAGGAQAALAESQLKFIDNPLRVTDVPEADRDKEVVGCPNRKVENDLFGFQVKMLIVLLAYGATWITLVLD